MMTNSPATPATTAVLGDKVKVQVGVFPTGLIAFYFNLTRDGEEACLSHPQPILVTEWSDVFAAMWIMETRTGLATEIVEVCAMDEVVPMAPTSGLIH